MPETLNPTGAPQTIPPFMGLFLGFAPQTATFWKHSSDLYAAYLSKLISARGPGDILLANANLMAASLTELSRLQVDLSRAAPPRGKDIAG